MDAHQFLQMLAAALTVYAGIRADLRRLHDRVDEAHERIDQLNQGESHGKEAPHASA